MNKMNLIRTINATIWVVVAIVLMVLAYKTWSLNGSYTFMSFFVSLIMHGGLCYFLGYFVDNNIKNLFK